MFDSRLYFCLSLFLDFLHTLTESFGARAFLDIPEITPSLVNYSYHFYTGSFSSTIVGSAYVRLFTIYLFSYSQALTAYGIWHTFRICDFVTHFSRRFFFQQLSTDTDHFFDRTIMYFLPTLYGLRSALMTVCVCPEQCDAW